METKIIYLIVIMLIIVIIGAVIVYFVFFYNSGKVSKFMTQVPMNATLNEISEAEIIEKMVLQDTKKYEALGLEKMHREEKEGLAVLMREKASLRAGISDAYEDRMKSVDDRANLEFKQLNEKYEHDAKYAGEEMKLGYDQLMRRIAHERYVRGLPWPSVETPEQAKLQAEFTETGRKQFDKIRSEYDAAFAKIVAMYKQEYEKIKALSDTEKQNIARAQKKTL